MVAHARKTPDVEVGAMLLGQPFLIEEDVPHRLGVHVSEAVPLAEGTKGDEVRLRITPTALAAVAPDEARGRYRAGIAHSHPSGSERRRLLPSAE